MSELLESVKRLAEYQERTGTQLTLNYITLAKHLARLERVEVAVRKAKHYLEHRTTCKYLWDGVECDCGYIAASAALDAALSENADVELRED